MKGQWENKESIFQADPYLGTHYILELICRQDSWTSGHTFPQKQVMNGDSFQV